MLTTEEIVRIVESILTYQENVFVHIIKKMRFWLLSPSCASGKVMEPPMDQAAVHEKQQIKTISSFCAIGRSNTIEVLMRSLS